MPKVTKKRAIDAKKPSYADIVVDTPRGLSPPYVNVNFGPMGSGAVTGQGVDRGKNEEATHVAMDRDGGAGG
ncbi:MAG: hypothetical protein ABR580_09975, partial [Halomonas sp.]